MILVKLGKKKNENKDLPGEVRDVEKLNSFSISHLLWSTFDQMPLKWQLLQQEMVCDPLN